MLLAIIPAHSSLRNLRMYRRFMIRSQRILLRRNIKQPIRHRNLQHTVYHILVTLLPCCHIHHTPMQMLFQKGLDILGLKVFERAHIRFRERARAVGNRIFEIVGQRRGDGDNVCIDDVALTLAGAVGAAGVAVGGEYAGKPDFVFLGHEALGLGVIDLTNEKMDAEGVVEGVSDSC